MQGVPSVCVCVCVKYMHNGMGLQSLPETETMSRIKGGSSSKQRGLDFKIWQIPPPFAAARLVDVKQIVNHISIKNIKVYLHKIYVDREVNVDLLLSSTLEHVNFIIFIKYTLLTVL